MFETATLAIGKHSLLYKVETVSAVKSNTLDYLSDVRSIDCGFIYE
jgi:hypothetical protein